PTPPPTSTLFPYTTLFRSPWPLHARRRGVDQWPADAAVPPTRHAWLGLSLHSPGPDRHGGDVEPARYAGRGGRQARCAGASSWADRKSTRLNSSHSQISYA